LLATGKNLKLGTVVARLTANGKIAALDLTTQGQPTGAETAYGILIQDTDATTADKETIIVARCDGRLKRSYLARWNNDRTRKHSD
jgi:hypothetical protein